MGWIISERSGDVHRFDEAIKRAKSGLMEACTIWEDMKGEFSERGGSYGERYHDYGERVPRDYYGREWDMMPERRVRHY